MRPAQRFPLQTVLDLFPTIRLSIDPVSGNPNSITALARSIGVEVRTVQRWKVEGITLHGADLVAQSLGTHPALIWADYHDPLDVVA